MDVLAPAAPVTMAVASPAAFVAAARGLHRVAYTAGLSCATPVLGVAWGVFTAATASAAAGQAASLALHWPRYGTSGGRGAVEVGWHRRVFWPSGMGGGQRPRGQPGDRREAITDAILGSLVYAVLGRGVSIALPSNVCFPGVFADKRRSVELVGPHYAMVRRGGESLSRESTQ